MALTVLLRTDIRTPKSPKGNESEGSQGSQDHEDHEYVCHFSEDEGEYWFLYPLFEALSKETGQFVDLYGNATFGDETLAPLAHLIAEARRLVASQPDYFEVVMGRVMGSQLSPVEKEVRVTISRHAVQSLLDKLDGAVRRAQASGSSVTFWGD